MRLQDYIPITKTIKATWCPNGVRIEVGETIGGNFQLHFYKNEQLKIVKKCNNEADAIQQLGKYVNRYYTQEIGE
jgi:hypothetical protein